MAIAISLLGVIAYLALRFDLRFGLAATAATFHDVLVVLGICWLLNIEISLLIVTALLTLAGYSLNDTGDHLRPYPGKPAPEQDGGETSMRSSISASMRC